MEKHSYGDSSPLFDYINNTDYNGTIGLTVKFYVQPGSEGRFQVRKAKPISKET